MRRTHLRALALLGLCSAFPGIASAAVGEFAPGGTAVGISPSGTVIVGGTDASGSWIDELRGDGTRVRRIGTPRTTTSVGADAAGTIYAVDDSGELRRFAAGAAVPVTAPGFSAVVIGSDGTVFGLRPGPDCALVRLTPALEVLNTLAACGFGTGQIYELSARLDLTAAPDGSLLLAQPDLPRLTQFSPAGAQVGSLPLASLGVSFTTGAQVAAAPGGLAWIAPGPRGGTPTLWRTDAIAGVRDMQPLGVVAPQIAAGVRDMVVGSDGTAYLALQAGGVVRLDAQPQATIAAGSLKVAGAPLTLDGSRSWQPFASITRYEWDLDDNGSFETDTAGTPTATVASAPSGSARYAVRVTGSAGGTATGALTVEVAPSAPIAALAVPEWAVAGRRVTLGAAGSTSAGGRLTFRWDLDGSGRFATAAGPQVTHIFPRRGRVFVGVRATTTSGESNTTFRALSVLPKPPRGRVGVVVAGGARTLTTRRARLSLVWPAGARRALVANNRSFRRARALRLAADVPWKLDARGPGSISMVFVRFIGPGITNPLTYSDEITVAAPR